MGLVELASLARPGQAGFIEPHLHVTLLAAEDGLALWHVRCSCPVSGFQAREVTPEPLLVLVQRGSFARRTPRGRTRVDAGFGYFATPDVEEEFAHPEPGGDLSTSLMIAPHVLAGLTGGDVTLPARPVAIDACTYRRVRSLVAEVRTRTLDDWAEQALALFEELLRAARSRPVAARRARTAASHRAAIDATREALIADPGLSVPELARVVGYSPSYLSRTFRRSTGTGISAYRLRLRTRAAVARIEAGETNLAHLAAELGFADHSHLSRAVARETGATPTSIRLSSAASAPLASSA